MKRFAPMLLQGASMPRSNLQVINQPRGPQLCGTQHHQCIASAKTDDRAQQYVDDHRSLDRCSAEISVRGA